MRWAMVLRRGFTVLGLAVLGCGGRISSICDAAAECEGGNDADREVCEIEGEAFEDEAQVKDCAEELDVLLECFEAEADCDDEKYGIKGDDCENEAEDLDDCLD